MKRNVGTCVSFLVSLSQPLLSIIVFTGQDFIKAEKGNFVLVVDCYFVCVCARYSDTGKLGAQCFLLEVIRGRIHRYILAAFSLSRDRKQLHTQH